MILLLAVAFAATPSEARRRSSSTVKSERTKTKKEIEQTRRKIEDNKHKVREQLNNLSNINKEIELQNVVMENIQERIDSLETHISVLSDSISANEARIGRLREALADKLVESRRRRKTMSPTAFVFSASTFSQMAKRMNYLRQLEAALSDRALTLRQATEALDRRKTNLESDKKSLAAEYERLESVKAELSQKRGKVDSIVKSLNKDGAALRSVLADKQRRIRQLDKELDRIIAEEAKKAAEAERKAREAERKEKKNRKTDPGKTEKEKPAGTAPANTPGEVSAMTGGFEANKGRLPVPVNASYTIYSTFGTNTHPDLSQVKTQNTGIDLETKAGASARAVFAGEVSYIFSMEGFSTVVIVRHGSYLTVYGGLNALKVKKGAKVSAGDILGAIAPNPDEGGRYLLHFEVRHETKKLNPLEWIGR